MKEHRDPWFIRLPDGRVVKAKSTAAVQHHLEAGHIPLNSYARREAGDEWVALAWVAEFADLAAGRPRPVRPDNGAAGVPAERAAESGLKTGVSARLDPLKLQTVGVRGYVDELIAALDSTVNATKLWVGCLTGVAVALAWLLIHWFLRFVELDATWPALLLSGLAAATLLALGVTLITRQTQLELTTMRPISWRATRTGSGRQFLRVFVIFLIVGGVGSALLYLCHRFPAWVEQPAGEGGVRGLEPEEAIVTAAGILGVLLSVVVFIGIGLAMLIAPALIVEDSSVAGALREWRALCREHRLRVFLYEGLAIALGVAATLPLAVPIYLGLANGLFPYENLAVECTRWGLRGLAFGPLIAFLAVANVFIYLNLRYEYSPHK
jgi:hypothetical protein